MTTCTTFANSIKKRVEAGKDLDTIAGELCTDVKFSREKVIRVIKDFLGEKFLEEHAETLGYDVEKARLAKMKKSLKKVPAPAPCEISNSTEKVTRVSDSFPGTEELANELHKLVDRFGFDKVTSLLATIQQEILSNQLVEKTTKKHNS